MNFSFHHINSSGVYPTASQRMMESYPSLNQENGDLDYTAYNSRSTVGETQKLSSSFDPRGAKSMPVLEKVTNWLNSVPWKELDDGVWILDCYPGHAMSIDDSDDWRSSDNQDIVEQQARQITRIVTENYLYNGESSVRPGQSEPSQCSDELYFYEDQPDEY